MKRLAYVVMGTLVFVLIVVQCVLMWLYSKSPDYGGVNELNGLKQDVKVVWDDNAIPRIEASCEHDAQMALGYLHASERLFQMELMRRIGSGELAAMVGQPGIKVDRLVRTLGLPQYAQKSAEDFASVSDKAIRESAQAYYDGINAFIAEGDTPEELVLLGIEPQPYSITDAYYVMGAMALGFAMAQKTEPVTSEIHHKWGKQYLEDIGLWHSQEESFAPWSGVAGGDSVLQKWAVALSNMEHEFPALSFSGSNSWVISGSRTTSGGVILCNDTHIAYHLPQTWYEAHLVSPGHDLQGHFMAAIPFALVGQDDHKAWGLTMLLNDDMDFYLEKNGASSENTYSYGETEVAYSVHTETISVKDLPDTMIEVRESIHGPIINGAFSEFSKTEPVSVYWSYTRNTNQNLEALYQINHARDISSFERGAMLIHGPGLNITYGDTAGHIAWWAAARFMKRNPSSTPWAIMDGSNPINDVAGYYDSSFNPRNIDASSGMIISANDWPEAARDSNGKMIWYPGYYKPQYRADRIRKLLNSREQWDLESMQTVMSDIVNEVDAEIFRKWKVDIDSNHWDLDNGLIKNFDWNGEYKHCALGPLLFNVMNYNMLRFALSDEMGEELFQEFLKTHQMQRCMGVLYNRRDSPWWDNINTDSIETYREILDSAFIVSGRTLAEPQLHTRHQGYNPEKWTWRCYYPFHIGMTQGMQKHPLGEIGILSILNLPCQQDGGNETIQQAGFVPDKGFSFSIYYGSQMRIITDLKQREYWYNCTPAGQSGHIYSKYYRNQNDDYLHSRFMKRFKNPDQQHVQTLKVPS